MRPEVEETGSRLQRVLDGATRDLDDWAWLWDDDHPFPVSSHRPGIVGRLVVGCKRLLRPLVRAPQADLWERQRAFNQVLLSHLRELRQLLEAVDDLGKEIQQVQREILADLRGVQAEINADVRGVAEALDEFRQKGMVDLMRHTDALFARLDQKVDRLRRRFSEAGGGDSPV